MVKKIFLSPNEFSSRICKTTHSQYEKKCTASYVGYIADENINNDLLSMNREDKIQF